MFTGCVFPCDPKHRIPRMWIFAVRAGWWLLLLGFLSCDVTLRPLFRFLQP